MHILFVQFSLEGTGGIQRVIPALAKGLSSRGHEVSAFVFYGVVPAASVPWRNKYSCSEANTRDWLHRIMKFFSRVITLARVVRTSKADVIIASSQGAALISLFALFGQRRKVPVIIYAHESLSAGTLIHEVFMRLFYARARRIVCVSEGLRSEFSKALPVPQHMLSVIYNAFVPSEGKGQCAEYPDNLPRPHLISASRLEEERGLFPLLNAFFRYAASNSGTLIICGTGSQESLLRKYVIRSGFAERVVFLGFCDNVPSCIARADCYVSCARREAFGMALLEAFSEHIAVVTTDAPYGPREIMMPNGGSIRAYPHKTPYGVLFSDPEAAVSDPATFNARFTAAINMVFMQGGEYDPASFDARVADFSLLRHVDAWDVLLANLHS